MKTATFRDLRYDFPKLEVWLAGGEEILITKHSPLADEYGSAMREPLHFSGLLEFEFHQSIELQVWLHQADQMVADWQADIATGLNAVAPCDMDAILHLAATYSTQRTAKNGNRTLDALHVATAVHLGARDFLTFDARQKKPARHAGLKVPF